MRTYINRPSTNIRFQFITENIFPLSVFYSEYCYAFSKLQRTYLRFQFSTAHIYTLQFSTANIATLQFSTANISTLQFSTANIATLQFSTANISTLQFSTANISIYLQCTMYRLRVRVFNVHISVNLYTFLIIANAIFVYCLVLILSRFLCA